MTSIRRRGASLAVLSLAGMGWGCGGVVLPDDARPAGIKIVSGDGQSAPAGQALDQPLVVQVIDALNRPVEGQTVTFGIDAGGGTVAPGSAETGTDGKASATWTLGSGAGQQTLHAQVTGDGAPAALQVSFSATAQTGVGANLVLASGDNQSAAVGSALPDSLVVKVTDVAGNPVAGVPVHWSVDGGGSISPETVASDANGLAAAQRVLGNTSGTQSAQASSDNLPTITFTHTAEPANPTALLLISGDGQSAEAGATLTDSLTVRLVDDNGNGVGGKAISWLVAPGSGTVSPVNVTTSPTGIAQTSWTLGAGQGANHLNAVFSGVPPVPFTATGTSGSAVKIAFTVPPVNTSAGSAITPAVKVAFQDAGGNTVTSVNGTVTLAIGSNPAGGTLSGTVSVGAVNGVATFSNLSIDKVGAGYTLVAGADGFADVTSQTFDILAGGANRLVFLTGPTNVLVGQKFSPALQVQVQDAGGNPVLIATGKITIISSVNGTLTGTASATPLLGTATFSNLAINQVGTAYTLTALASGVQSVTSDPFDVGQAGTTIAITSKVPNGTAAVGQPVTFRYNIDPVAPASGTPTGTVLVADAEGTGSCTGSIDVNGVGSCDIAFTTAGLKNVTATYAGDVNFGGSTSIVKQHTAVRANTLLSITSDEPEPSSPGQTITVQWTLAINGSGTGVTPTGNVTVSVNSTPSVACTPVQAAFGAGSCQLAIADPGQYSITASYAGDANLNPSSDNEPHTVSAAGSTTTLSSSLNPSTVGDNVTFTAHVAPASGGGTPTGTVKFFEGAIQIGQANLDGSGDAQITKNDLAQGDHAITAKYLGTASFSASTSAPLTQTVNAPANQPPVANADGYSVAHDAVLSVDAPGVLANDSDPDGSPASLTAQNASQGTHGTVTMQGDGSFTYTPEPGYSGPDSFTYEAFDGAAATQATVNITITP